MDFPSSFIWGTATSSPQSEGCFEGSDWRAWERSGLVVPSGTGNGKWSRYEEDFNSLSQLGLTHHRTSLDWSRIEPQKGVYNRDAIEHYRSVMDTARRRGMTLWVCLHHFTLPAWFVRMGGFLDPTAIMYWHRYVELVGKELGSMADYWMPVSQPVFYALATNLLGKMPPGRKRMDKFLDMLAAIHRAHGDAFRLLKTYIPPRARIGLNALIIPTFPHEADSEQDSVSAEFMDTYFNSFSLELLKEGVANLPGKGAIELPTCKNAADFLGVDYFFRLLVSSRADAPVTDCLKELCRGEGMPAMSVCREGDVVSECGFGSRPEGLYESVKRVYQSGLDLPIYITGTGLATRDEEQRCQYIRSLLHSVLQASEQGLDVRGLFYWSDVDGYEWTHGYDLHYGLSGFDPETGERKKRPAADLLGAAAREGRIAD
ncbi:MAG: family 1 glycosylhydrolase [bacterium]